MSKKTRKREPRTKRKIASQKQSSKSKKTTKKSSKKSSKPRPKKPQARPSKPTKRKRSAPRTKQPRKKLTRRTFERRPRRAPRDGEVPEGFEPIPGQISIDMAYAVIQLRLEEAKARLPEGYEGRVLLHAYADGSIDGELYVKVPEGVTTGDTEFEMYDAFSSIAVGDHFWISVGARYMVETDDERYRRYKGMTQVQTNYQIANQANIVEEHAILRSSLITGMERKFEEEAHSVFVRLHWNAQDEQPKR